MEEEDINLGVPKEGEDDGEMEPVKALDAKYYH
ncbi:hypothetical protein A2U01_0103039, partial [Trifolium medium]|nr:hypothetical protein [Trifolium medium]